MKLNTKILLSILLSILLILLCNNVFATTETYENLKYEIDNNEAKITGYNGNVVDVVIPNSIKDYPVTTITDRAFVNCTSLKSIKLPDSITSLGESVFMYCTNLSNVTLSNNLKDISANLFCGCANLKNIVIPNGIKKIDGGAFCETSLIDVVIPNTVTEIWYGAFFDCTNLKTVTIPSSVTFLGDDGNGDGIFDWDMEGEPLVNRITLKVEKGSYAEKYAQNNKIKYEIIGSKEDTKVNLSNNSIKIDTTTNVIPQDTKLLVEEVTSGNNYDVVSKAVEQDVNKFILYDISLESNNAKIQPNGKVKVSIPLPTNYDKTNITVYRVEDNGNKIEYTTKIENVNNQDYVVFETEHFSNYVIAEKKAVNEKAEISTEETKKEENKEHKLDNEPKTGIISIVSILSIIITFSIVGIVISKNKMYK